MIERVSDEQLQREDYDSVFAAMRIMTERGWRDGTLNEHVDQWAQVVEAACKGYDMTIDDYTNDLDVRRWLEEVRTLVTERVRRSLDARLEPLDARFREATVLPSRRLPGLGEEWWCRLPKILVGDLREDVERMQRLR